MKRKITLMTACLISLMASAQTGGQEVGQQIIDLSEDSTEITTIKDIIEAQQQATNLNAAEKHFHDVWERRSYMNLGFSMSKLNPSDPIPTGLGTNVPEFKSDWGVSFQYGRSYRLHKTPIANALQFNIDYTGVDINVNHYSAEGGSPLFDSSKEFKLEGDDSKAYFYTPWQLEKYEASYNMSLGPSLTIAPFNGANERALHYVKLNVYYHIGYQFSMLMMSSDSSKDKNTDTKGMRFQDMDDAKALDWAHGVVTMFGFNLSWKNIGIGFEHRSSKPKYKSMATSVFSQEKFKFDSSVNRIYLQYRM